MGGDWRRPCESPQTPQVWPRSRLRAATGVGVARFFVAGGLAEKIISTPIQISLERNIAAPSRVAIPHPASTIGACSVAPSCTDSENSSRHPRRATGALDHDDDLAHRHPDPFGLVHH